MKEMKKAGRSVVVQTGGYLELSLFEVPALMACSKSRPQGESFILAAATR